MEISDALGFPAGDVGSEPVSHRPQVRDERRFPGAGSPGDGAAAGPGRAQYEETGRMCLGYHPGTARRILEYGTSGGPVAR